MDFAETPFQAEGLETSTFGIFDDHSVQEAVERIEPFLKGSVQEGPST